MNKLFLMFLVLIGIVSGALIGMNSHELSKENLDKGDKAISITNMVIGAILFFIGLAILLFTEKMPTRMINKKELVISDSSIAMPRMKTTSPTVSRNKVKSMSEDIIVPDELNLSSM